MSGNNKDTTAMILTAMDQLGPADARTIAEKADVGYSTAVRKLREWAAAQEIVKIDRGSDPAHFALRPTDQPLPAHLRPTRPNTDTEPITAGETPDADKQSTTASNPEPEAANRHDSQDAHQTHEPVDLAAQRGINTDPDAAQAMGDAEGEQPQLPVVSTPTATDDGDSARAADGARTDGLDAQGEVSDAGAQVDTDGVAGDDPVPSEDEKQPEYADGGEAGAQPPASAHAPIDPPVSDTAAADQGQAAERVKASRRPKDYFRIESLTVLRAQPDESYTAGEVAKLIVAKEIAAGAPASTKASSGAVSNALHKAAGAGECLVVCDKPVKFQAA